MKRGRDRWTEQELVSEIERLGDRIDSTALCSDEHSRYVVSYLQQVLNVRRDALTVLQKRRQGLVS